jgi:hypothetical protein
LFTLTLKRPLFRFCGEGIDVRGRARRRHHLDSRHSEVGSRE